MYALTHKIIPSFRVPCIQQHADGAFTAESPDFRAGRRSDLCIWRSLRAYSENTMIKALSNVGLVNREASLLITRF